MSQNKFREIKPDSRYNNLQVAKFINYLTQRGQKDTARKVLYEAFSIIKKKTNRDPVDVFEEAIEKSAPRLEVKSRRIGGANYQVPYEVKGKRRFTLAARWIIDAARSGSGTSMANRLAKELIDDANEEGKAQQKKINMHRMAEANKAFAHFAF